MLDLISIVEIELASIPTLGAFRLNTIHKENRWVLRVCCDSTSNGDRERYCYENDADEILQRQEEEIVFEEEQDLNQEMDARYGARNHQHELRPHRERNYDHLFAVTMTQILHEQRFKNVWRRRG